MADHQAILDEEFEVLESIFPDELEKTSDREVRIRVEPEDPSPSHPLILHFTVQYPEMYPDVIPIMSLEPVDDDSGELDEEETKKVIGILEASAEESLGMAMTFTIASSAREALGQIVRDRIQEADDKENRRVAEYEEAEAKRTRGTPLTRESFNGWRKKYTDELLGKREREEEERVRALIPREREEWRKRRERPSGRQLFETSRALATSDEALYEEGAAEVDLKQYTREERENERRREEEEEEKRRKGLVGGDDSDGE